jgi:tight adherence protein C
MTATLTIALATFLTVAASLMGLYFYLESRYRRYVLAKLLRGGAPARPVRQRLEAPWHDIALRLGRLAIPKEEHQRHTIRQLLTVAGYRDPQAVTAYFGVKVLLAAGLGLLYLILTAAAGALDAKNLVVAFLPIGLGYYLPGFWLRYRVERRRRQIFRELPDVLDLLLICIEAGLSFDMALFRVSRELSDIAPVLSAEFGQYFFEIKSGLPRRQVMADLAARNGEQSLTSVINVLLQSSKFGTDIAEALRIYIQSMRTERRQLAEEKGAKMSTRLVFPMVVLIMPALIIVILGPALINIFERLQQGF